MNRTRSLLALTVACSFLTNRALAQANLTELSLEDLMNLEVEVSSVSRRTEKLSRVASAVSVLSGEDLRRAGVRNLPEALRLVPGVLVQQLDANRWSISIRGFGGQFSNKLLVSIDGRTVYTPLFSGVFWELQNVLIDDVERIEVIRGPGAAMWGANAVNGVINVITESASETQGGLYFREYDTRESNEESVRYGATRANGDSWRVWARRFDYDSSEDTAGNEGEDHWDLAHGGFRLDSKPAEPSTWTLQGDVYDGQIRNQYVTAQPGTAVPDVFSDTVDLSGANLLHRWSKTDGDSRVTLQSYFDHTERDTTMYADKRDTLDFDFTHELAPTNLGRLMWGFNVRGKFSEISRESFVLSFNEDSRTDWMVGAFVQDAIELVPDELELQLGAKFEHIDTTGVEVQPDVRMTWTPTGGPTTWLGVSRAVRTPSQVEQNARFVQQVIPGPADTWIVVQGDNDVEHEELYAYQLGTRWETKGGVSFDIAAFFHDYDELLATVPGTPFLAGNGVFIVPIEFENAGRAQSWGLESSLMWPLSSVTRVLLGGTWMEIDARPGSGSSTFERDLEAQPAWQGWMRVSHDLGETIDLDGTFAYVDDTRNAGVDETYRADVNVTWHFLEQGELSFGARGLFHDDEVEAGASGFVNPSNRVEASAFVALRLRF